MTAAHYIAVLRRWSPALIAVTLLATIVSLIVLSRAAPVNEARTTLLVGDVNQDLDALRASTDLVGTYGDLLVSEPFLREAAEAVPGLDVDAVRDASSVAFNSQTRLITLTVRHPEAAVALEVAGVLARRLVQEASSAGQRPAGEVDLRVAPFVEEVPDNRLLVVALAAVAALVAAAVLALLVDSMLRLVRTREDVDEAVDAGVVATVAGRVARDASSASHLLSDPGYRLVAAHLDVLIGSGGAGSMVAIAGVDDHDDGRAVASNVAAALAAGGRRVALVVCGSPAPQSPHTEPDRWLWRAAAVPEGQVLLLEASGGEVLVSRYLGPPAITVIATSPSGTPVPGIARALQPLLDAADVLVLAPGPLVSSPLGLAFAAVADTVLLVARAGRTRSTALAEAAGAVGLVLPTQGARAEGAPSRGRIGVVLNQPAGLRLRQARQVRDPSERDTTPHEAPQTTRVLGR